MAYIALFILLAASYFGGIALYKGDKQREALIKKLEYYNSLVFHIVVESLSPDDNQEYLRAADEREWIKESENENGVQVIVIAFRDDGFYDETWEEYQGRLALRKKEIEHKRHEEIRKLNVDGYRKVVLGKKMPDLVTAATVPIFTVGDHVGLGLILFCIVAGWLMMPSTAQVQQKRFRKAKKHRFLNVNGVIYKEDLQK